MSSGRQCHQVIFPGTGLDSPHPGEPAAYPRRVRWQRRGDMAMGRWLAGGSPAVSPAPVCRVATHWRGAAFALRAASGQAGGDLYRDAGERERAIRYNRTREWLMLAGMAWSGATSLLALATGLSARLRDGAERVALRRLGPPMPYTLAASLLS